MRTVELRAPMAGTVVAVPEVGRALAGGRAVVVLESMKMEHPVPVPPLDEAEVAEVLRVEVAVGAGVRRDQLLAVLRIGAGDHSAAPDGRPAAVDATRTDLAEVLDRHARTLDESRPAAVARRARLGLRTARANVADLCDPGTFVEYGALAVAAQRGRRPLEELIEQTPADGLVAGLGDVAGRHCAVLAYDATVLAGTQGVRNHQKTDRLLEVAGRTGAPVVLFAEGGGGRPGDTDMPVIAGLDVPTFHRFAGLSGRVPLVGVAAGRCFAGNAALLGCCDVVVATRGANIGMGGPAMIEGGGLGVHAPEEIGPVEVQAANGVVDVVVDDEAAAVDVVKALLAVTAGASLDGTVDGTAGGTGHADQERLRDLVPQDRVRAYDVRAVIETLADTGSVLELRPGHAPGMVTAFARIEGRPVGVLANSSEHLGGAIDAEGGLKAARFLKLCDRWGVPVLSLCDTPGFMVGPEAEATGTVRHFGDLFVAAASLRVPVLMVVLRKAYGLGAMAMATGGLKVPLATVGWPTAEIGAMGLEGAVRLGFRRELEAVEDEGERQRLFDDMVELAYEHGKGLNAASMFELDDVIDPADTRRWIVSLLGRT